MGFESQAVYPSAELCLIGAFMTQEYGIAPEQWLLGTGIRADQLDQPDLLVSMFHFDIIHRNIFRLANDPAVGLKLGAALNLSRWGLLSTAFISAPSVGEALMYANKFKALVRSRFTLVKKVVDDNVQINIQSQPESSFPISLAFGHEVFLNSLKQQIQDLSAEAFSYTRVELSYPRPSHYRDYAQHLNCPVSFDAPQSKVYLSRARMNKPLPLANAAVASQARKACEKEIQKIEKIGAGDISWQINQVLNSVQSAMSLAEMAECLSLHPRTLRRKLQHAGTSFSELLMEHKKQQAGHMILERQLSVMQVAEACGYKTTSAFRSAFKSWYGTTPSEFRRAI